MDTMYWKLENTGIYSVKSAYRSLQSRKGAWYIQHNDSFWRTLWRIKAPPKTLNLVWRALACCLPTLVQLYQKHVPVQRRCQVCIGETETIYHALVGCRFAVQCWKTLDPDIYIGGETEFHIWFERVISERNINQRAEIVTLCWAIWRARNELVWNKKTSTVNRVVATAREYLTQWKAAQVRSTSALLQPMMDGDGAMTWVKPQRNVVKVTVDAANFDDHDAFGIGLVARDWKGDLIQAKSKLFQGRGSPELAEGVAIKEALNWIMSLNWPSVVIESDCLVAVQAIRSKTPMRSPFGVIIEECRRHILELNNVQLYFIKRSANMAAHELARASYSYPDRIFDRSSVPIEVINCMRADLFE